MACNDLADEGRLTIAVGARQIELATAIHCAIAVIVSLALEDPLVGHRRRAPLRRVHLASLGARLARPACGGRAESSACASRHLHRRVASGGTSTCRCYGNAVKAPRNWALSGPQKCVKMANIGSEPAIAVEKMEVSRRGQAKDQAPGRLHGA